MDLGRAEDPGVHGAAAMLGGVLQRRLDQRDLHPDAPVIRITTTSSPQSATGGPGEPAESPSITGGHSRRGGRGGILGDEAREAGAPAVDEIQPFVLAQRLVVVEAPDSLDRSRTSARSASERSPTTRILIIERQVRTGATGPGTHPKLPLQPARASRKCCESRNWGRADYSFPTRKRGRRPRSPLMVSTTGQSGATPTLPSSPPKKAQRTSPSLPPGGQQNCRTRLRSGGSPRPRYRGPGRGAPGGRCRSRPCPPRRQSQACPAPPARSRPWVVSPAYQQGGHGPELVNAKESQFQNPGASASLRTGTFTSPMP